MNLYTLLPLFILAVLIGALIGHLGTVEMTRRALRDLALPQNEIVQIEKVNMICEVRAQDGRLVMTQAVTTNQQELMAHLVQSWLDRRDLMMTPKGRDFKVGEVPR